MAGGWSSQEKVISVSNPRRYSGMAGYEEAARNTCLVTCFCCLLEGLPSWIMYILQWASGYCSFSSRFPRHSWIAATCLGGRGGAGGAFWAMGPTAILASGWVAIAMPRLFSSASSLKLLQFLSVWLDLSSPRSFLNPCIEQGPLSYSLADRYVLVPSRGCLVLHSLFWSWDASSGLSRRCILLSLRDLPSRSSGKPAATMSGPLLS